MENNEGGLSIEELRLRARCSTLEGLIAHLQEENTNLRINHDDLQARSKALERAWLNVQSQLGAANRAEIPGNNELLPSRGTAPMANMSVDPPPTDGSAENRDRGFEDWYKRDDVSLPPIESLGLEEGVQNTKGVTLPRLQVSSHVALENVPTPESPVPANSHSVTDQTQSHTVDSSDLSSPRLPFTPLVKHEEDESQPTPPTPTTKRTRKGVMSSGVRAPKRKNPDDYTDDPPTPFGERRSNRVRVAVNYDEGDFENIGQLAEEAWEEDSESRSTSSESAEETDEDLDDMPPPAPDRPSTPSPKPDGNDTPTSNTKKRRYKKRPTKDRARWAKGTDVQVRFRFEWKPPTVLGLYEEWYQGVNGNPSIESLETKYGAKWRNHPEKNYNAYANDWVNKRRRVIKALNYFAEKQGKRPYELAHEWDKVVQGRISQLVDTLPPPTAFERMKDTMVDPLLHFALLPKKNKRRLRRR